MSATEENAARELHRAVIRVVMDLARGDPAPDTPIGRALVGLAEAVERFEVAVFPIADDAGAGIGHE